MNQGRHRAIFNEALGAWIAVSELARTRGRPGAVVTAAAAVLVALLGPVVPAWAQTPVASAVTQLLPRAGASLPSNVKISTPSAQRTLIEQTGRTAVIQWDRFNLGQGDTLQFRHLDAAGAPDARGATLNRIWDANPSLINGRIESNGTVYLVNRNGIQFGPNAVVDVGGLVASALNITDSVFEAGYLSRSGTGLPAFTFDDAQYRLVATLADLKADGKPATVRNEGRIQADDGGSVLLFAPQVENTGRIATRSGQVVLAAGQKVYLSSSSDAGLRGVLVEVDPFPAGGAVGSTVRNDTPQGVLRNGVNDVDALAAQMKGLIAQRGNVTLAAMAVNNNGRIEASTGKTENGSIYLQARGGAQFIAATETTPAQLIASQGGALELGPHSLLITPIEAPTEAQIQAQVAASFVPAEPGESAAVTASRLAQTESLVRKRYALGAGEVLKPSVIQLDGASVLARGGSLLRSPQGVVDVKAEATRFAGTEQLTTLDKTDSQHGPGERIVIEPGARLDVSGLGGDGETLDLARGTTSEFIYQFRPVAVAGAVNQVSAVLVSNELKDAPLQRDGILFKKTVQFNLLDAPSGKLAVADVSGAVAARTRTLAEASTAGGRLSLSAEDAIVLGQDAVLDVSGGSTAYSAARIATTVLGAGALQTDITQASADRRYDRLATVERDVAAYRQGGDGGTLVLNARQARIDGRLQGSTQAGRTQRSAATQPAAARLVVGDAEGGATQDTQNFGNGITFNPLPLAIGTATPVAAGFWAAPLAAPLFGADEAARTVLSPTLFGTGGNGFGDVRLYAGGTLAVEQGFTTPAAARLWLTATQGVRFGSDADPVQLRGAGLTLKAFSDGGVVRVGAGSRIDVSGLWVNDLLATRDATRAGFDGVLQIDGGSITLGNEASPISQVSLGPGSVLDVSGGARLSASGSASAGQAGSLSLVGIDALPDVGSLRGFAYATSATRGGAGGRLSLRSTANLQLGGDAPADSGTLRLDADFFTWGGFSSRSLATSLGNISVQAGASISPQRGLRDARRGTLQATGSAWADALPTLQLAASAGDAQQLTLSAAGVRLLPDTGNPDGGRITVAAGATLDVGTAGTLALAAKRQLTVAGTLAAAAGTLDLRMAGSLQTVNDEGYFADQAIYLTPSAVLDVAGRSLVSSDARGRRSGTVLDGGTVNLVANKGYVVVNGATLHLDGASDQVDVPTDGRRVALHSNAGAINLGSREGIAFQADISGRTGNASAAGPRFSLTLAEAAGSQGAAVELAPDATGSAYPQGERTVHVGEGVVPDLGRSTPAAPEVPALLDGRNAFVAPSALAGFSSITLRAQDAIRFEGSSTLSASRSVLLDTPRLALAPQAQARVAAPYVELRQSDITVPRASTVDGGDGTLSVVASQQLDLTGHNAISGSASTRLASDGVLRLNGVVLAPSGLADARPSASLIASGDMVLSATQIYASSATDASVLLPDAGSRLTLQRAGAGADPAAPLSAGSHLRLEADQLTQAGVLRAPFGEIELVGRSRITLAPGSLSSASGEGQLVPYGELENGSTWLRPTGDGQGSGQELLTHSPKPRLALRAPVIDQQAGSTVDLSGSGDLYAYEFVAGPGGSADVLASANTYAVIPGFGAATAPLDSLFGIGFDKAFGSQITLAAGAGLAAGTYTLLPAHYALLPGAFRITPVSGGTDIAADRSTPQALGGAVVAGREGVAGTALLAQRSGTWLVESSALLRQRAQYTEARGTAFFTQVAETAGRSPGQRPVDAGQLVVEASQAWVSTGRVDMSPGQWTRVDAAGAASRLTGLGGALDLRAPVLTVADPAAALPTTAGLRVDPAQIDAIGAASVVLGGERSIDAATGGATLQVVASQVSVAPGTVLGAGELVLAATETVHLGAGSRLVARPTAGALPGAAMHTQGDGALLRVAVDAHDVQRSSVNRSGGSNGTVIVDAGVAITGASVQIDGTRDSRLDASTTLAASTLTLGAAGFSFGGSAGASGLGLSDSLLDSLAGSVGQLTLRSYSGFDFAAGTSIGSTTAPLAALTLDGPRIAWTGAAIGGAVHITARALTLQNTTGQAATAGATPPASAATLNLSAPADSAGGAGTLTLGDGTLALQGFAQATLDAANALVFDGQGSLSQGGDLRLRSPLITGTANTRHGLVASGALRTEAGSAGTTRAGAAAQISLQGQSVEHGTRLAVDGGNLTLRATTGDLTLLPGGSVEAAGRDTRIGDQTVSSDAGTVTLAASTGQVRLQAGSLLDVSGRGSADAGRLVISAPNAQVQLDGQLRAGLTEAARAAGVAGAELALDVQRLDSLDALNARTTDFSGERNVRVRQGDLQLSTGQTLQARRIALAADVGDVDIAGTLDANGPQGGRIELAARRAIDPSGQARGGNVRLRDSAQLLARATAAGGQGGEVLISVSADSPEHEPDTRITLARDSLIDVSGGPASGSTAAGRGGSVTLRTPRLNNESDWQVQAAQLSLVGAASALVGSIDLGDARIYQTRAPAQVSARSSFAPNAGLTGSGGNRTLQLTLPASTDLATGFFFTWTSGSITSVGTPTLRVTLDNGSVVGGTTGVNAQIFAAATDAGVANPAGTPLSWSTSGFRNGATYFVQRRANRWVVDTRVTPVSTGRVELVQLQDSAFTKTAGARLFFELSEAITTSNPQFYIGGQRYLLQDKDGAAFTADTLASDLPVGTRLAAEFTPSVGNPKLAGTLRLLNRPGDARPVGLTVAGLASHTTLRAIHFAADEDVAGGAVALYINSLPVELLRSTDDSADGRVSSSGVNTIAFQAGRYLQYAGAQQRFLSASNGGAFADSPLLVFRPAPDNAGSLLPIQVRFGSDTLALRDAAGNALAQLSADQAYWAVRDGSSALRLVDTSNIQSRLALDNAGATITGARVVQLEGVKTVTTAVVDRSLQDTLRSASQLFDSQRDAVVARSFAAGAPAGAALRVTPGFEIRSTGDLLVADTWDLGSQHNGSFDWRFGAGAEAAGALTLRAAGTLRLQGSLLDGATIAGGTARAPSDQSWTLRLAGGADLNAASLDGSRADGLGDIVLSPNARVQTGTAEVSLSAAGSIRFSAGSTVLTTGARFEDAVFQAFGTPQLESNRANASSPTVTGAGGGFYTHDGGNLRLRAGGDIVGLGDRPVSEWLWLMGSYQADGLSYQNHPTWWVRPDRFAHSAGTLGGGDISVRAAGDIRNFSAMLPTQGVVSGSGVADGVAHVLGGGNLDLRAGGNLVDGQFLIDQGSASLRANGAITGTRAGAPGLRLYVGDAQVSVAGAGDVTVAQISSATVQPQASLVSDPRAQSAFFRYAADSAVSLLSAAGDVRLAATGALRDGSRADILPPTLAAAALAGNITLPDLDLAPSPTGQLSLLAAGNLQMGGSAVGTVHGVRLLDADPTSLPSATRPAWGNPLDGTVYLQPQRRWDAFALPFTAATAADSEVSVRVASPGWAGTLHEGDRQPVRLATAQGDIGGTLVSAKSVDLAAGRDASNLLLVAQNLGSDDLTRVSAVRDIVFPEQRDSATQALIANRNGIQVYGPGRAEVQAGRHVQLGAASGITTDGPGNNPVLPDRGADLRVTAGAAARVDNPALVQQFIGTYLRGTAGQPDYRAAWADFARQQGLDADPARADATAFDRFRTQVLWSELAIAGTEGNALKLDAEAHPGKYTAAELDYRRVYGRGYTAITLAGLDARADAVGELRMAFSQLKTRAGGNLEVLVPAGSLEVGGTRPLGSKTASQLGLVATEGDARVLVRDSVAVNTSRWFAIDGGNILGWASLGSIDAGRGARTAVSSSSQRLDVDIETGRFRLVDAGGASGSGIATLFNRPVLGGDVKLFAPNGLIDAGEAGIRAAGSLQLTLNVANADFIVAVGASNAPAAVATPSLAGLSLGSSAGTAATASATAAPSSSGERPRSALLTVEVLPGSDNTATTPVPAESAQAAAQREAASARAARQRCLAQARSAAETTACGPE